MPIKRVLRVVCAAFCLAVWSFTGSPALAQSGNPKPPEPQKPATDSAKEGQKSIDEIAEAARLLTGPAATRNASG